MPLEKLSGRAMIHRYRSAATATGWLGNGLAEPALPHLDTKPSELCAPGLRPQNKKKETVSFVTAEVTYSGSGGNDSYPTTLVKILPSFSHVKLPVTVVLLDPFRIEVPRETRSEGPETPSTTPIRNLFIGSYHAAKDEKWLVTNKVGYVVDVGSGAPEAFPESLKYLHLDFLDVPVAKLCTAFSQAHKFIEAGLATGQGVLVHCHAGISRSATIVVSYLMRKLGLSFQDSLKALRNHRPFVKPNDGFVDQLVAYEEFLQQFKQKG